MKKKGKLANDTASIGSGYLSDIKTQNFSNATDSLFSDAQKLRNVIDQYTNCDTSFTKGRAFEFLESLKFNYDANLKESDLRAETTHYYKPGDQFYIKHGPSDINILKDGELIREVQAKSSETASDSIFYQAKDKYEGMGRLINSNHKDKASELLKSRIESGTLKSDQYKDVEKNLMEKLNHDEVSSSGTTLDESKFTVDHPYLKEIELKFESVSKEVGAGAAEGLKYGAIAGVVFQGIKQTYNVAKGKKKANEALVDGIVGAIEVSAKGAFIGGGAKGISLIFRQCGQAGFAKTAGPAAIAASILELATLTRKLSNNDITKDEYIHQCGGTIFKSTSVYYYGMAGQALIPIPVLGGLVGAMAGYVASALLYNSGLLGIGSNSIVASATQERIHSEKIANDSIKKMVEFKLKIQEIQNDYENDFNINLMEPLLNFEKCLHNNDYDNGFKLLLSLNKQYSSSLPFETFEEFHEIMLNEDIKLVI